MAPGASQFHTSHTFYSDEELTAGFSKYPITPGHAVVGIHGNTSLTAMSLSAFVAIMVKVRRLSVTLCAVSSVRRCALVYDGAMSISLIPLHGLGEKWKPVVDEDIVYYEKFPGFITSKSGPKLSDADLDTTRMAISDVSGLREPLNLTFDGPESDQNLFARIIRGELPNWKIWEDDSHVALLNPFANTPGFTVLVPRRHLCSDILSLSEREYLEMLRATFTCGNILIKAFNISHCGFIFEGFEIDYAHIKLIPLHQTVGDKESYGNSYGQASSHAEFQPTYSGYVTSQPGPLLIDLDSVMKANEAMREALKQGRP